MLTSPVDAAVFTTLPFPIRRVGVILGKNQLDYWKLENPTSSKLEKWGCIPWIFTCWKNVLDFYLLEKCFGFLPVGKMFCR